MREKRCKQKERAARTLPPRKEGASAWAYVLAETLPGDFVFWIPQNLGRAQPVEDQRGVCVPMCLSRFCFSGGGPAGRAASGRPNRERGARGPPSFTRAKRVTGLTASEARGRRALRSRSEHQKKRRGSLPPAAWG